jgi:hypothetical protein
MILFYMLYAIVLGDASVLAIFPDYNYDSIV